MKTSSRLRTEEIAEAVLSSISYGSPSTAPREHAVFEISNALEEYAEEAVKVERRDWFAAADAFMQARKEDDPIKMSACVRVLLDLSQRGPL